MCFTTSKIIILVDYIYLWLQKFPTRASGNMKNIYFLNLYTNLPKTIMRIIITAAIAHPPRNPFETAAIWKVPSRQDKELEYYLSLLHTAYQPYLCTCIYNGLYRGIRYHLCPLHK